MNDQQLFATEARRTQRKAGRLHDVTTLRMTPCPPCLCGQSSANEELA